MLHERNQPLLLWLSVQQQLLGRTITNKLAVNSTTDTLFKLKFLLTFSRQKSMSMLLNERSCSLPIERFKANNLVKTYNLFKYCFFTYFCRLSQSDLKKCFGKVFLTNFIITWSYLPRYCVFAESLQIVSYVQGALRKELLMAPFTERFKTVELR